MLNALALYARLLSMSLRKSLQYRASFVLLSLGQFLVTGVEFLGPYALFARFSRLGAWSFAEVALFYGVVNLIFSFADAFGRGFDLFPEQVKTGGFDRTLVRPRSTFLQVAGQEFALFRISRLAQAVAIFAWAAHALELRATPGACALLLLTLIGGTCLFVGLFVLQATLAFWTTETLELMNTLTYGGVEAAQYPLELYGVWFRRFFTFVVPLAAIAYFPVLALLERPDPLGSPYWFQCSAPLLGVVFLFVSAQLWKVGVRHYTSTGS
jgi:ABC-2 type transport system permease protein